MNTKGSAEIRGAPSLARRSLQRALASLAVLGCVVCSPIAGLAQQVSASGCSPALTGSSGNVVVNCDIGLTPDEIKELTKAAVSGTAGPLNERIVDLSKELGVTQGAIAALLKIIGEKGDIPPDQLPQALAKVAENYKRLLAQVEQVKSGDPAEELTHRANIALQAGQLDQANKLLDEAATVQLSAAQAAAREASLAEQRAKLAAARTTAARGDLALAELKYSRAAELFADAASYVPPEYQAARGIYLERQAVSLYRQGDVQVDSSVLRKAIEMYRQTLIQLTQKQAPDDWAIAENNFGNALLALGDRENNISLLIEAIGAYQAASKEITKDKAPVEWARIQGNLVTAQAKLDVLDSPTWPRRLSDRLTRLTAAQVAIAILIFTALTWLSTILFLYWRDPGRLVRWHERLPEPAALDESSKALEKLTLGFSVALVWFAKGLILFLGTSPRALEAWVRDRLDFARSLFAARASVRDRRIALTLPLRIDDVHFAEPWSQIDLIFSRKSAKVAGVFDTTPKTRIAIGICCSANRVFAA